MFRLELENLRDADPCPAPALLAFQFPDSACTVGPVPASGWDSSDSWEGTAPVGDGMTDTGRCGQAKMRARVDQ